ncbi:MAG: IPT/TIG domain-containing protein, partial [Gemmatimonadota bacterium]
MLVVATLLALAGCSREPVAPGFVPLEVVVAGGDEQYATAGTELSDPLRVIVREVDSRLPVDDVTVRWAVTSGDAQLEGPEATVTDEAGAAEITVRLGSTEGQITIVATVVEQDGPRAELRSYLVGTPRLTSVEPVEAPVGATLVLAGQNFSPVPEQNLVYFSNVRARVLQASATSLEVEVPLCLPARADVRVRVALGAVSSGTIGVDVTEGGPVEPLLPGEYVDLSDPAGMDCVQLSGERVAGVQAEYIIIPQAAGTVAGASYPMRLAGLAQNAVVAAPPGPFTAGLTAPGG